MDRRTVTVCGAALALVAGAGVVGVGERLASQRQKEREHYRLELVRLRQEAARTPEKPALAIAPPAAETRTICAAGADTLTLAAYHAAPTPLVKDGRLEVAKFAALSDESVRAERYVEATHEPPALPHRMGAVAAPACFPISVSKPPAKAPAPARSNRVRGR